MKTIFQVTIESDLTVSSKQIEDAIRDLDLTKSNIKGITVDLKETVYSVSKKTLTLPEIIDLANKRGERAVEAFFAQHGEPLYCGRAYLYTTKPKPRTRTGKRIVDQTFYPTGRAARTQSLDMQEAWTKAAMEVFDAHGVEVQEKSWVD